MYGCLLAFYYFCLVCALFSSPSLLKMQFCRTFSLVSVSFFRVSKPTSIKNSFQGTCSFCYSPPPNSTSCCRWTHFMLDFNILVLKTNTLKITFELHPDTHTQLHVATRDFQTGLMSRWLLPTSTVHVVTSKNTWYHAVVLTLSTLQVTNQEVR